MPQKHPLSHLPIPQEVELEQIVQLIESHKDSPQALKVLEDSIPPHIMQALIEYCTKERCKAQQRAKNAQQKLNIMKQKLSIAKQSLKENKALTNEILQFKKSIQPKIDLAKKSNHP